MATQYTPILQLALPVTGELNGTWGDVVNDNITSMVEQAIAGLATINTWTTNSHTLTTADGTTDEARCAMLVASDGAGLIAAGEIICPARTKLYVLKNSSSYAITLKTSAGTGVAVPVGDTAFLFCDGTNVGACVTTIVNGHIAGNLTVDGNTVLGNATSDTITANARIASDLNPSVDNTYDLGTAGNSWRNLYVDGTATIATLNVTTIDTTNLEVTNIKAKDGTTAITLADSTGVATFSATPVLNAGTINQVQFLNASKQLVGDADFTFDGTTLSVAGLTLTNSPTLNGGTANQVQFLNASKVLSGDADLTFDGTTLTAANFTSGGTVTLSGGTANGVAYLNGSKVLTTGSALTFDGALLSISGSLKAANEIRLGSGWATVWGSSGYAVSITGNTTANTMTFGVNSAEQMRLTSTGLGIGTSSPAYKLDVNGIANFAVNTIHRVGGQPMFAQSASNTISYLYTGSTAMAWRNQVDSAELMRLDSSGNLGLGVTPSAWGSGGFIDFFGNGCVGNTSTLSSNNLTLAHNAYYASGAWNYKSTFAAGRFDIQGGNHRWYTAPSGTAGNAISFTQAMTLDASGNLGIGTSSPNSYGKLAVIGGGIYANPTTADSGLQVIGDASSVNQKFDVQISRNGGAYTYARINLSGQDVFSIGGNLSSYVNDFSLNNVYGGSILFKQYGSERMRIDSSGNLGLGVTPSAWNTFPAFQIAGNYALSGLGLSNNMYYQSGYKYISTAAASRYEQSGGGHSWFTAPSGTAGNAISFTQAMTLDASGNLGVGVTSGLSKIDASGTNRIQLRTNDAFPEVRSITPNGSAFKELGLNGLDVRVLTSNTERMRIDSSGNVLVGTTSGGGVGGLTVYPQGSGANSAAISVYNKSNTVFETCQQFRYNGTVAGSIGYTNTATTYATSSDYRLKENIQPMQNALAVVQQLNPVTYNWKADGSDGQGFIAHELQAVVPDCVTGEKDAVDGEGKPVYQGIDTSFLVATLTKAIQEQQEQINQLTARVAQLEGK